MASEYFYGGKLYSTDPKYGNFTGYQMNASQLSQAVDPRTANQIKELTETLNTGIKNVEVGNVQPNVFEAIPKEHFKEMNRLAKLTGAELSFHAPMIDPTGITDKGWDKMTQDSAERQLWDAIKKGAELNPKGTVVTFHASSVGLPSAEWVEKDNGDKNGKVKSMIIIDVNSGKVGQVKEEKSYFESNKPGEFKMLSPQEKLQELNEDNWMQTLSNLNFSAERGRQDIRQARQLLENNPFAEKTFSEKEKKIFEQDAPKEYQENKMKYDFANKELGNAKIFLRESYRNLKNLYDDIYNKGLSDEDRKKLQGFAEQVKPFINDEKAFQELEKNPEQLYKFADAIESGVKIMGNITKPKIYQEIKEFAIDKSAETTANLAWRGYTDQDLKKQGIAAPTIALENHPAQQSLLTRGSEIRAVVDEARKKFIEKAKENGVSEGEAKKQAEKLIGATWDVGHINMMRRYGFSGEDIIKETEALVGNNGKNIVKKVHLSDNFGFEHTELPMGMGNVPIAEIMKRVGKEGFDVKKVIEAGDWWQHFSPGGKSNPPIVPTMQAFGSPVYSGGQTWNHIYGVPGGYFGGYGTMLPEQNFQLYGAGFSSLPQELGGQMANKDSKFSGTPMS